MNRTSRALVAGAAVALAAGIAPTVNAIALDGPPGNNGTVKIDGQPFDTHPNNEPHVGCIFEVDWYGFDSDAVSNVKFELHPPTTGPNAPITDTVQLDGDDNAGGGSEPGLDAEREYNLSRLVAGVKPHPIQGHHIKLTINTTGSIGADVKHKVFWVKDCRGGQPS